VNLPSILAEIERRLADRPDQAAGSAMSNLTDEGLLDLATSVVAVLVRRGGLGRPDLPPLRDPPSPWAGSFAARTARD
jgi:hypothetical protein